jgi:integrase
VVTAASHLSTAEATLSRAQRAEAYLVGSEGTIRRHKDGRLYLDFGPRRRVWCLPFEGTTVPFTPELAESALKRIRARVADKMPLDEALAPFLPASGKAALVSVRMERWLEVKAAQVEAGDRSPTYLRTLEHYAKPGGVMSFWDGKSIHEVRYATLEDWDLWLMARRVPPRFQPLSPTSRRRIVGAFRSFLGWLEKRGELRQLPEIPWPKDAEHEPQILSQATQQAVLAEIPEGRRGIFLAMAELGLRNGEARALDASDYQDGHITISKAVKGPAVDAPIRAPKNGRWRRLPVPEGLAGWLARNVPAQARLEGRPLFVHPATGERWAPTAMKREWHLACDRAGAPRGKLYEGTRHSTATRWKAEGADDRTIQTILGHVDSRSVARYARLADGAVVDVLRPGKPGQKG